MAQDPRVPPLSRSIRRDIAASRRTEPEEPEVEYRSGAWEVVQLPDASLSLVQAWTISDFPISLQEFDLKFTNGIKSRLGTHAGELVWPFGPCGAAWTSFLPTIFRLTWQDRRPSHTAFGRLTCSAFAGGSTVVYTFVNGQIGRYTADATFELPIAQGRNEAIVAIEDATSATELAAVLRMDWMPFDRERCRWL